MALVNPDDTYIHYQYIIKEFFILINGENIRINKNYYEMESKASEANSNDEESDNSESSQSD